LNCSLKFITLAYHLLSNSNYIAPVTKSIRNIPLIINLIIYIIIIPSCKHKEDKYSFTATEITEILAANNDSTGKRPFKKIINQIAVYPAVDGSAVGIAGMQSEQYRRFLWLKQNATEEELIQLTDNSNANVKVYAFMALCERNSPVCKEIYERHIADKAQFYKYGGCIQMPEYVNVFYLDYLSRILNPEEVARYKKELSQQFTPEGWEMVERMSIYK
jgi:hypothetical protein